MLEVRSNGAFRNHSHGQLQRAKTVKVVSNELAKVLVDVKNCHGLKIVRSSYQGRKSAQFVDGSHPTLTVAIAAELLAP